MSDALALFQAIQAGDAATVTDMVEARADLLHARSPSGLSPLLFAAYYHRPQMAALLLDLGAPVSVFEAAAVGSQAHLEGALDTDPALLHAFSSDGFSLLGLSAFFGHLQTARLLLDRGAEVNAASHNAMRVTPLHSAAAGDHAPLVHLLLRAGADPNVAQHGGYTPLHSAAQNGNTELVRALLEAGADRSARTDGGHDALSLARENGHADAAALLEGAGPPNLNSR